MANYGMRFLIPLSLGLFGQGTLAGQNELPGHTLCGPIPPAPETWLDTPVAAGLHARLPPGYSRSEEGVYHNYAVRLTSGAARGLLRWDTLGPRTPDGEAVVYVDGVPVSPEPARVAPGLYRCSVRIGTEFGVLEVWRHNNFAAWTYILAIHAPLDGDTTLVLSAMTADSTEQLQLLQALLSTRRH